MKCSLLVVTTDRLVLVKRLFHSLVAQTHKDFEVIFLYEESCATGANALVDAFRSTLDIQSLCVPRCGISKARNLGLPLLSGKIIAFPDDDCVYTPDTLGNIVAIFSAYSDANVLLATRADLNEAIPAVTDTNAVHIVNHYALFGCSETFLQFYRSTCVQHVGFFDEKPEAGTGLLYGCGEDTDYTLRAMQAEFMVLRVPSIYVRHPAVDFRDQAISAKVEAYACGRMYLLRKHALPLWFRVTNVIYPLAALARELQQRGLQTLRYRWRMFFARMTNF